MTLSVTSPRNKTWKKVKGENKKCHCSENRQRKKVFEVGNQWLRDTSHRGERERKIVLVFYCNLPIKT